MTAVITGAGKGIGRAVALRLARDHDALVLMDVDAEALSLVAAELPTPVTVRTVVVSVAGAADCARSREAAAELGGADVLSHNAGIQRYGTVETTTEALWDEVLSVNLKGAFLTSQALMPQLRASRGCVVHMASVQGFASQAGVVAYSTAKHGLVGLVHAMSVDAVLFGVRVNGIAPGSVDTPMLRESIALADDPDAVWAVINGHAPPRPAGPGRRNRRSRCLPGRWLRRPSSPARCCASMAA